MAVLVQATQDHPGVAFSLLAVTAALVLDGRLKEAARRAANTTA